MGHECIRVLVAYQHLPHYRFDVFKELQRTPGIDVTFAADIGSQDGSIPTIPANRLDNFVRLNNRWLPGGWLWQSGLLRACLGGNYDVLIFLGDARYLSTWVCAPISRSLGKKVLFWTIGWHRPDRGFAQAFKMAFYRRANHLLLYGHLGASIGIKLGFPGERITVVKNSSSVPVEEVDTHNGGEQLSLPSDLPVVLAVVRLNKVKKLEMIIAAAALLAERGKPVQVVLIGEGHERARLQSEAKLSGVRLVMPGALYSSAALQRYYDAASVTVIPELAGLSTLQSLRHGTPVITCDDPYRQMPEFEAIIEGYSGSLYRSGDVDDMARKIELWIDPQTRSSSEVADACRHSVADGWNARDQAQAITKAVIASLEN